MQVSTSPGGVPKLPVGEGRVGVLGIEGDAQSHTGVHGGPDRALCLYSAEVIEALSAEGHSIGYGSAGENVTIAGVDWSLVVPGVRLRLGADVEIEVTSFTNPCTIISRWFADGDSRRIHQEQHPGFSRVCARVLSVGVIRPGDPVEVAG